MLKTGIHGSWSRFSENQIMYVMSVVWTFVPTKIIATTYMNEEMNKTTKVCPYAWRSIGRCVANSAARPASPARPGRWRPRQIQRTCTRPCQLPAEDVRRKKKEISIIGKLCTTTFQLLAKLFMTAILVTSDQFYMVDNSIFVAEFHLISYFWLV